MKTLNRTLMAALFALPLLLTIVGCASEGVTRAMSGPPQVRTDIFPGNHWNYLFGTFQKFENFTNVERAQWNSSPRNLPRNWGDITPQRNPIANLGNLQHYFRFDVRWKLKNGNEFILEDIDVRTVSNTFLRANPIQLQWQREGRARDKVGDYDPLLAFEVKDDTVLLKWIVRINQTPVEQRLTTTGAATKWDIQHEEIMMATLRGTPTSDIDFDKRRELVK